MAPALGLAARELFSDHWYRMEPTKKILVVDDNEWILETMYELLIPAEKTAASQFEEMASSLFNNPTATQFAA